MDDEWQAEIYDSILARTTALFAERGDERVVALLVDVRTMTISDGSTVIGRNENAWTNLPEEVYNRAALLDVDDHLVNRFTNDVLQQISAVLGYVAGRLGEPNITEVRVQPALPDIVGDWREIFAGRLGRDLVSNQARRERNLANYPVEDGLTFGSKEELTVYKVLKDLQQGAPEDRTIAIAPSPGVRLRAGHTWTPDFVVLGNRRAVVIEVDGPHHRSSRRFADDKNRDLQWQRCGVPTVRLPVEDISDVTGLKARLAEEVRHHLWR
ncbi:hypothetical protein BH93_27065 (plasmid) [Rhodococcoides fascians A25f]|uniref:hypothetical protein n=1 Tax=Rhodococcoides fascians TaxID=1828 RepID=UPI00068C3D8C|nr:hypothetical protein [Rhodococcus fascians]QII09239.1 hypothetical protein BH93_27065 [Rhodococcus fascians A25f]